MITIQNESNKETKQNERRQKRENMVEDIDTGRLFELATTEREYVYGLNLHDIKNDILEDYTGDFELIGSMLVGEIEQKTNIRFKNVDDFESYINAIDNSGYDSEDVIFTGWLYKLNTPEFKKVNRSQYGRGTDFKQDIVEYIGNNCYIPTSGICFIKCINYFTKKDYTEDFLTFIRTEQRRSNVMTSARIQPFFIKHNINIGCYDGFRVCPRIITRRNIALKIHNNHFCLIWKSYGVSFDKAIRELKDNFQVVDNVISDKHVKSYIEYEYKPKKAQSQLTNMIVYDIETFSTIKCVPYANCIYRLSKISGKYYRDISEKEYQKCLNDCIVFKGLDNINKMLDYVLQYKGEPKRINRKIVKNKLHLIAHKGSGFDSYVVLNNQPQWRTVKLIKNGSGIVSLEIFNGYVDQNKKIPQYVHLRCGLLHIKDSLKNIGKSYKLHPCLLKQELEHDEIFEDNCEEKENDWLPYLKNDVLSTAFSYARYSKGMEELTGFGMKNSLTLPSLANKYFNSLRDESDEPIYTYNDEFMRHFLRKSIKGGRCSALNQYYKSNISQEVFNIISKELGINDNDNVCEIIDKYFEDTNKQRKIIKDEYDSKFKDYRDIDVEERTEHINKELNKLPIHKKLQKLNHNDVMMDFDATSLYPSAMWDEKSVYPKIESGFAFKPYMNKTYVEAFNNETFNQDGDESAILRIKYYNPPNLIFQHLPVKEKVKNVEVNRKRNGYIIDVLTSVDICEIVKNGGRVIEIYEGVLNRKNFKVSPFRKVIEKNLL